MAKITLWETKKKQKQTQKINGETNIERKKKIPSPPPSVFWLMMKHLFPITPCLIGLT